MPRQARRGVGEDGMVSTEFVIIVPVVIFVLWLAIQLAMWAMAAQAVQAAAAAGGQSARLLRGSGAQAQIAAQDALSGLGGNMVQNPTVGVNTIGQNTVVEVSAHVYRVLPFFNVSVTGKSQAPQQEYRVSG